MYNVYTMASVDILSAQATEQSVLQLHTSGDVEKKMHIRTLSPSLTLSLRLTNTQRNNASYRIDLDPLSFSSHTQTLQRQKHIFILL